jgi:hypothetical protein
MEKIIVTNQYHYRLNLPVEFIPKHIEQCEFRCPYPINLVNQELVDWLKSIGILLHMGEEFLLDPSGTSKHDIHLDGNKQNMFLKLNYVFCDTPHVMNWYKLKSDNTLKTINSDGGTPYLVCNPDDCEIVYSAEVGKPSLVNVMELHDVSTVKSKRYCFSFVLISIEKRRPIVWEEAEEIFKDYIVGS